LREKFRRIGVYNKHSKSSLVCERILHVSLYVNLCRFGEDWSSDVYVLRIRNGVYVNHTLTQAICKVVPTVINNMNEL